MDVFRYAGNATFPLILLILTGCIVRKTGMVGENFFQQCRKIVFYLFLPCSIFLNIYNLESLEAVNLRLTLYVFAAVMVLFGLGVLVSLSFPDRRKRGVLIQAAFRSNYNIIAVPLAQMLGGQAGLAAAAVLMVTTIPQFNILAVISMTMFLGKKQERQSWKSLLLEIIKNPLVISSLAGLGCLLLRWWLPCNDLGEPIFSLFGTLPVVYDTVGSLAKVATPLALVTLGGLLDFQKLGGCLRDLAIGTVLRLLVAPVLGLGGAYLLVRAGVLTLNAGEFASLLAVFAPPLATVTGIMAAQMDNDDVLADDLVLVTTAVSALTIFGFACLLRAVGLI